MRFIIFLFIYFSIVFCTCSFGQNFPVLKNLSTGQGVIGSQDPVWQVSDWYSMNSPIPDPLNISFKPAKINQNCAPGSWVSSNSLPSPVNNGNWITSDENLSCQTNRQFGFIFYRLTINLPSLCNAKSLDDSYKLYFTGYVDNQIKDVYLNGVSKSISGGDYTSSGRINFQINGPWKVGFNYIDVLVWNYDVGGQINPYGLLLVVDHDKSSLSDLDNDGISDINDLCPCNKGSDITGCIIDSDKDGVSDEDDIDDDNDGVLDITEQEKCIEDKSFDQALELGNAVFTNCLGTVDGPGVNFLGGQYFAFIWSKIYWISSNGSILFDFA
jgi:hypothetical protein